MRFPGGGLLHVKRDERKRNVDIITGDQSVDTAVSTYSPGGHPYVMSVRPGTSDANTVLSCSGQHDEYSLPRELEGWLLDVGAHIGAASVPLLLDKPRARLVAVEALPENVALLEENLRRNGVAERAVVVYAAAGDGADLEVGYSADPVHQYIGSPAGSSSSRSVHVPGATLGDLMRARGHDADEPFVWAKLDWEGCEYGVLASHQVASLLRIKGEVHRGWAPLLELLEATHDVSGPGQDFGPFTAVLRAHPLDEQLAELERQAGAQL